MFSNDYLEGFSDAKRAMRACIDEQRKSPTTGRGFYYILDGLNDDQLQRVISFVESFSPEGNQYLKAHQEGEA